MSTINDCVVDVTTDGVGTQSSTDFTVDAFDLSGGKYLQLTLWISDVSKIGDMFVYVSDVADVASHHFRWRFDASTSSSKIGKTGEEFRVTLQLSEVDAALGHFAVSSRGVVSPVAGLVTMRFGVKDAATGAISVRLLRTRLVTPTKTGSYVSLAFDDGYASQLDLALPRLKMHGFRGTIYPSFDEIGEVGFLGIDQLKTMAAAGWEVGAHHTTQFPTMTAATLRTTLANIASMLRVNFYASTKPIGLAYPGGLYEDTTDGLSVEALVADAGFTYGRTILAEVGVSTNVQINALSPLAPYRLRAASSVSDAASAGSPVRPERLIGPGGMLDKVEAHGGWLILVFHRIVTGVAANSTECDEEDLASIVDALVDRPTIKVAPVMDVITGAV